MDVFACVACALFLLDAPFRAFAETSRPLERGHDSIEGLTRLRWLAAGQLIHSAHPLYTPDSNRGRAFDGITGLTRNRD